MPVDEPGHELLLRELGRINSELAAQRRLSAMTVHDLGNPAQVIMGDTGALALGSSLAIVALMTGQWLLLPIIGIIFVAEALSDVIQIGYFKLSHGKRVFKRAPIHNHFEEIGWAETQIVTRFWLVGIAAAVLGVAFALAVPA